MCLPASHVDSLDGNRQALEQESCFSRISHRICQVRQEFLAIDAHGGKYFQGHWKEIVGLTERAVTFSMPIQCWYTLNGVLPRTYTITD